MSGRWWQRVHSPGELGAVVLTQVVGAGLRAPPGGGGGGVCSVSAVKVCEGGGIPVPVSPVGTALSRLIYGAAR